MPFFNTWSEPDLAGVRPLLGYSDTDFEPEAPLVLGAIASSEARSFNEGDSLGYPSLLAISTTDSPFYRVPIFTWECWAKLDVMPDPADFASAMFDLQIYFQDGSRPNQGAIIGVLGSTGDWECWVGHGTFDGSFGVLNAGPVSIGAWTHLVLTATGADIKFYKDGALADSATMPNPYQVNTSTRSIEIGLNPSFGSGFTWPFQGDLDEVAIYNSVLSAGQVAAHYSARTDFDGYRTTILGDSPIGYWRIGAGAGAAQQGWSVGHLRMG